MRRYIIRSIVQLAVILAMLANFTAVYAGSLISTKDEIEIGRSVGEKLEKKYGLVNDPELQARIHKIGMSMVAVCDRRDLPYSFKVLNSKEVNALAAPGGYIYVFKGLIDLMPSDDELAGVIGHEIGHIVKRHTVRQIEKSIGIGLLFQIAFGDRGIFLQNLAYNAIMAGYSRADEREADNLGFIHSYRAGYNPYSMVMGLKKLSELDQKYHYDLFSDHPESKSRIALVEGRMNDFKIRPRAVELDGGKAAQVVDGQWKLPPFYTQFNGYKPIYRAYFAAGNIYRVTGSPDYSSEKYILVQDGDNLTVFYDEMPVLTITPQDAAVYNLELVELGNRYLEVLKQWQ